MNFHDWTRSRFVPKCYIYEEDGTPLPTIGQEWTCKKCNEKIVIPGDGEKRPQIYGCKPKKGG